MGARVASCWWRMAYGEAVVYIEGMLRREARAGGVVVYVSPALERAGVPHGFSTRIGGISTGPFESLNLGNPTGVEVQDDWGRVEENWERFLRAAGVGTRERCSVHQVHGAAVVRVSEGCGHDRAVKADALVTADPARAVAVRVADCMPVLMASADGRVVAAVHAGWRGVVAGVVGKALAEMGREAGEVVAAVGPCIGADAFEVGPEVVAEFQRVFGADAPVQKRADGKGHVDLKEAVRRQLTGAGVREIDVSDRCTHRDADEFFSHRRDNGLTGRMAAVIGVK